MNEADTQTNKNKDPKTKKHPTTTQKTNHPQKFQKQSKKKIKWKKNKSWTGFTFRRSPTPVHNGKFSWVGKPWKQI